MKWQGRRQSDNVEDRRAFGGGKGKIAAGGGIIGIIVLLLSMFGGEQGQQVAGVLNQVNQGQEVSQEPTRELTAEEKELGAFASTVFADCEDVWSAIFEKNKLTYRFPKMVLFAESVQTDCGPADAAVGPFYCPADETVYMDLTFFEELKTRFGAEGGDFAIAYVIAHEVGHHVQNVLGTSREIREAQEGASEKRKNQLSVKLELQADFYAGIFSYYNKNYLEAGDIDEALSAAHAVGDDAIQKRMRGSVEPDSFTHGTSVQRKEAFMKGFSSGDISLGEIRFAQ